MRVDPNDAAFQYFEKSEFEEPVPRKVYVDRTIYESQGMIMPASDGQPTLCDLGEARFGQDTYTDLIQPVQYRAPEVILCIPWTYSADVWNLGLVAWNMIENKHLFTGEDEQGEESDGHHLAQMVAALGPPPASILARSANASQYFDESGKMCSEIETTVVTLEASTSKVEGDEKAIFLDFIRKMLCWVPEERQSAAQLLQDPWLNS